jgi:hypothetical protein
MDTRVEALAGRQQGTFTIGEARALGVDDHVLRKAVADGLLVRVRRGAYVDGRLWAAADRAERYRLEVLAVARTRPGDSLSHHAALAIHGLPLWDFTSERIDLESDVGRVTSRRGITFHPRSEAPAVEASGVLVVPVARALIGVALTMGRACAVVAGDQALRLGLVTRQALVAEAALLTPHQGRRRAHEAVLAMDGQSESVREARTRLVLLDLGLQPLSQVVLRDAQGRFVARVDLMVEGVVVEFDGRVKYERRRDAEDGPDAQPAQVLWLEKRREDAIRRLGHPVERIIWSELDRPGLLGARLRSALDLVPPHLRNTPAYRLARPPAGEAGSR